MRRRVQLLLIAILLAAVLAVLGCSRTVVVKPGPTPPPPPPSKQVGPPPHAPAHGYRHKHPDGVVLVFESELGLYIVSGHKDLYFHNDRYYRLRNGEWCASVHVNGPWDVVAVKKLPPGLYKKSTNVGKATGKEKKPKKNK